MRRHVESYYLVLFTIILEFKRTVALIAINNKQPIHPNSMLLCMGVKVLKPLKCNLIIGPASSSLMKNPVVWCIREPGRDKHLA